MDGAIQNYCFDVIEWLVRNRTELEMTDKHLDCMIKCRRPILVLLLYDRDELKSWPRRAHARILFDLFESGHSLDVSILLHIVRKRQNRYRSNAPDNPFCANDDDFEPASNQERKGIILASVTKACEGRGIADENCMLISDFVAGDPSRMCTHMDALTRGWVHWLLRYSNQPDRDIELLVEQGQFDEAYVLHDRLRQAGRLNCSDWLMSLTAEKGELAFVQWHMLNCDSHSEEDWLYTAVWIGRLDVVNWMHQNRLRYNAPTRSSSYKMLVPSNASFTLVARRFKLDLAGSNNEGKEGGMSGGISISAVDKAAIRGDIGFMKRYRTTLRDNDVDRCTVMGLYGAMINGHLEIVRLIYENQLELANCPKLEDGSDVLRCLINRDLPEMLKYFRHERGMRLDSSYLEEAVLHDCRFLVQLICDLDLVGPTSLALDIAAVQGNIEMLKTLTKSVDNPPYSTQAISGAAEEGHLLVIQYLQAQGVSCSHQPLDLATKSGHLEVVEYLVEQYGARCSEWAVYWASACGHERVVRYLVTRVAYDLEKCVAVAKLQGHLRIVKIFGHSRATQNQSIAPQRSSTHLARRRQQEREESEVFPTKVIFREVERLLLSKGLSMSPNVLP